MFDLEREIKKWKTAFSRYDSLEDGFIADMEMHLREAYEIRKDVGCSDEEALRRAVEQVGTAERIAAEYRKNREEALVRRASWRPARFMPGLLGNYLKAARRRIWRSKGYSFINVAGLALALACFVLLMMWVKDEVGWDRFHENARRIYRLEPYSAPYPITPAALAPFLKANYPEVAAAVRYLWQSPQIVQNREKVFEEKAFVLADASVFDVFTIPFVAGDRATAFKDPETAVLTQSAALKYFGSDDPIGRVLTMEGSRLVRITGVVQDPPQNADWQYAILGNFAMLRRQEPNIDSNWGNFGYTTYVKLAPAADAASLSRKIARLLQEHDPSVSNPLMMTALWRIHLYSDGAINDVVTLSLVSLLILLIAACNFINLATARSSQRAKELAVRKIVGARRIQLIRQFLGESVLLALLALLIALAIVVLVLPAFNTITGKLFSQADLLRPGMFLLLLGTAIVIGILSGAYPALLLSAIRPAGLLKSGGPASPQRAGGYRLRKILVVTQFCISIMLMISTLFIAKQMAFVRGYHIGIQKDNIVILPAKKPLLARRDAFLHELTSQPGIVNATFASSLPSQVMNTATGFSWEGMDAGLKPNWAFVAVDNHYLDTLGIALTKGRNFPADRSVQEAPYFIVNQRAAAEMKLGNPLGKRFNVWKWNGTVLGVVSDFHFRTLHEEIKPLLLFVYPEIYNFVLVKIRPGIGMPTSMIVERIQKLWDEFAPGFPFNWEFLDAAYGRNYQAEQNQEKEFGYFTALGIFIACLGLFGLASASAERKRKEVGIRKVLGAPMPGMLWHMSRELVSPVVIANFIAWPLAYLLVQRWLQGFAYKASIGVGLFAASAAAMLAIALCTVSWQTWRAARANPVDSLRYE